MKWIELNRSKIKVYGKPAKLLMKGMTAPEEHTHFLHSLLTNNIKNLKPGQFNYNLWLRQNGQPVGDFFVYKLSDHYILDTEKPAQEVIEEFNRLKLSLKVYFEDLTPNLSHVFVFGEDAESFLKDAFGVSIKELEFTQTQNLIIANNPIRLKTPGYDLIGEVPTQLLDPKDKITPQEFEDLRIKNCVPKIGKELREGFSPLEAGVLSYAIDMNKGCYVGQEAIARVYFRGRTPRVLAKLQKLEGELKEGDKILSDSKAVGLITSVNSQGTEGLGYILRAQYQEGKELKTQSGKIKLGRSCEGETQKS